jgi:hypothetical protein
MWYVKHKDSPDDYYDIFLDEEANEWVCYAIDKYYAPYYETQEAAQKDIDNLGKVGVFLVPVFEQEGNW